MRRARRPQRIREVFLRPKAAYTVAETAAVLGLTDDEVRRRIADGSIEAFETTEGWHVPRKELIDVAMTEHWTPRAVAETLPPRLVPRLARSMRRTIGLPSYLWKLLRLLARERGCGVSDLIERAVHGEYVEELRDWRPYEKAVPGIREAAAWPGGEKDEE